MKYASLRNEMLRKAQESALLAVEVYNKPSVKFRSGGYVVLMVIAWTALFHAIFYNRKIKPYYKSRGKIVLFPDGSPKLWELDKCARMYFGNDTTNPVEANLGFFIPIRNEFEHRSYPAIDGDIFGECQALLLNFDNVLGNEFGDSARIRESLTFSLQLFPTGEPFAEAVKKNADLKRITEFINRYRSMISPEIFKSGKFSFKAFLIQVSNHNTKDSLPVQFVNFEKLTEEEREEIGRFINITREKVVERPVSNKGLMRPGDVVKRVQDGLGNPKKRNLWQKKIINAFSTNAHADCCKLYKVRPYKNSPSVTPNSRFCIYDEVNKVYLYTEEWVRFLIQELTPKNNFEKILNYNQNYQAWELLPTSGEK